MKPSDLVRECVATINRQPTLPFIVVQGKKPLGRGWPKADCIGSDHRGRFYSYDARELLVRLHQTGACVIDMTQHSEVTVEVDGQIFKVPYEAVVPDARPKEILAS